MCRFKFRLNSGKLSIQIYANMILLFIRKSETLWRVEDPTCLATIAQTLQAESYCGSTLVFKKVDFSFEHFCFRRTMSLLSQWQSILSTATVFAKFSQKIKKPFYPLKPWCMIHLRIMYMNYQSFSQKKDSIIFGQKLAIRS